MRTRIWFIALVLLGLAGASLTANPATTGALAGPANRIVGLWSTVGNVGPCGGPPTITVRNTLLFHAGGTLFENFAVPPASIANRNYGLGTWSYNPATRWHRLHLRFDRFENGAHVGYSTVDRTLLLNDDATEITGEVVATGYAPDGTITSQLCGEATSVRLR